MKRKKDDGEKKEREREGGRGGDAGGIRSLFVTYGVSSWSVT